MSAKDSKIQSLKEKPNIARYCVENPHVSWALLILVLIWGYYGYQQMPKSKDPNIPVRIALVSTPWPGHSAMEIEELVTRQVEQNIAQSPFLNDPNDRSFAMQSLTLPSVSFVQVQLAPGTDRDIAFNEIGLNLDSINANLPEGAGPISINSQFGDTAAVMLAIASPKVAEVEINLRAKDIRLAIVRSREGSSGAAKRATLVVPSPLDVDQAVINPVLSLFKAWLGDQQLGSDFELIQGAGFIGLDFIPGSDDAKLLESTSQFLYRRLGAERFYPDAWLPMVVRDPSGTAAALAAVAGDKYSYRQLDDFSDAIAANLQTIPEVSTVLRSGVLNQQIDLSYSQEVLAAYGILPSRIGQVISQRNTTVPGGVLQVEDMNVMLTPSGSFNSEKDIGGVMITRSQDGTPVYLRSLVDIQRGYQSPPPPVDFLHRSQ